MAGKPKGSRKDRRHSERQNIKIPVDYSAVDAFFSEFTTNINEGGMFIETENPPTLDSMVQLQVRLPDLERPIKLGGRVAWISDGKAGSPPGMGIEFQDMSPDLRQTINDLVRRLRHRD
ncbi:MAG TPA: TIGR02266 family protein [Myxococcota bacterium]|nr:TIGR02266 family protein [Myxococcota bacterium]